MTRKSLLLFIAMTCLFYGGSGWLMASVLDKTYGVLIAFCLLVFLIILSFIILTILDIEVEEMERKEMINDLARLAGIPLYVLENLKDEELKDLYDERILQRGMI